MEQTYSNWSTKTLTFEDFAKMYEKTEKYRLPKKIKMRSSFLYELRHTWDIEIKDQHLKLSDKMPEYFKGIPIEIDDYMKENYEVVW